MNTEHLTSSSATFKAILRLVAWVWIPVAVAAASADSTGTSITHLRCEGGDNGRGMAIESEKPRFSWWMQSSQQDEVQTAYQVEVEGAWDSGKVSSDQSLYVPYMGNELVSGKVYRWRARVWGRDGMVSSWSAYSEFWMAPKSWEAKWIAARDVPMNPPVGINYTQPRNPPGKFIARRGHADGRGYHALIAAQADTVKWVQVDLGAVIPIEKVRIRTLDNDDAKGFGFPMRYRLELGNDANLSDARMIQDCTASDVPNPGSTVLEVGGQGIKGRYVSLTAIKLFARPKKPSEFCFG